MRPIAWCALLGSLLTVCAGFTSVAIAAPAAPHAAVAARAPLPSDRLHFGLGNFDSSWMNSSGVPWRYRFQYLSGGVNTPGQQGWANWNSPPGQFATYYMTASTKPPANYIPVFTYYDLLQSLPSSGSGEKERDFNNLNNAGTMNAYYGNFKLLMQKAGAYGGQVVVHVEPDFWGYMQMQAAGGDATAVPAMVKSSGFGEANSFPDNLAGFASELKFLRDTYAPNALLAMHASMWASSMDVASNTDPNLNAAAEADKTAAFLNSAGAGAWDAVFNDVDDHNAAWWELKSCSTPPCVNQYYTHWWDPANVKFPNFTRYLSWVSELHTKTALPQVVWQVPMGNQYFLTLNNTCGHYQDNVAPYFISHASDLYAAGLVAVLFGGGNSCQTSYDDPYGDGVTNNGGSPTTDALGGCNACNTHVSVWPDDDGGYLRIFVGLYYTGCKTASVSPDLASPQLPGASIVFTASSTGCSSPTYEYWLQYPNGSWVMKRTFDSSPSWTWDTTALAPGNYTLHVWANQAGNPTTTWETYASLNYTLSGACTAAGVAANQGSPQPAGTTVQLTATSSGCPSPQYEFWLQYPSGTWVMKRVYGSGAAWSWDTAGYPAGLYTVHVWATHLGGDTSTWEAYGSLSFTLTVPAHCATAALSPTNPSAAAGSAVMLTASSTACPNPQYEFWVQYLDGSWHMLRGFGASTFSWGTAGFAPGVYTIHVWANQAGDPMATWEAYGSDTVTLTGCTSASIAPPSGSATVGTKVTFTASSNGCPSPVYAFWLQHPDGTWHLIGPFATANSWDWNTAGYPKGNYVIHVWANNQGADTSTWETYGTATYTLT
jgi:hypothetical protein